MQTPSNPNEQPRVPMDPDEALRQMMAQAAANAIEPPRARINPPQPVQAMAMQRETVGSLPPGQHPEQEALDLPGALILIANEMRQIKDTLNALLAHTNNNAKVMLEVADRQAAQVQELVRLVDGFTASGSCFNAYQTDPLAHAYLGVMGPLLATKLAGSIQSRDPIELIKVALPLTIDALQELDAYRQSFMARNQIGDALQGAGDPWRDQPMGGGLGEPPRSPQG